MMSWMRLFPSAKNRRISNATGVRQPLLLVSSDLAQKVMLLPIYCNMNSDKMENRHQRSVYVSSEFVCFHWRARGGAADNWSKSRVNHSVRTLDGDSLHGISTLKCMVRREVALELVQKVPQITPPALMSLFRGMALAGHTTKMRACIFNPVS